jgi:hypothetical protein
MVSLVCKRFLLVHSDSPVSEEVGDPQARLRCSSKPECGELLGVCGLGARAGNGAVAIIY